MDNPSKQPRRLWRVVLVLSLALNVAVIGAVIGLAVSGRAMDGRPQRISFDFGPIGRVLEPADRRAIGEALRRDGARPMARDEIDLKIRDLAAALRAEPFNPDLVAQQIGTFRDRTEKLQRDAQNAFVAHLMSMTPAERNILADKLEKGQRR